MEKPIDKLLMHERIHFFYIDNLVERIYRTKVFGGWLVNSYTSYKEKISESMTFIPDPEHKWVI